MGAVIHKNVICSNYFICQRLGNFPLLNTDVCRKRTYRCLLNLVTMVIQFR